MKHRIKDGECVVTHTDGERKVLGFDTDLGAVGPLVCTGSAVIDIWTARSRNLKAIEFADFIVRENIAVAGLPTENFLLVSMRADVKRMLEIAEAKNHDYGGKDSNPFANFMAVESLGIATAEKGILVRMTDKMSRINTLLSAEAKVNDESVADTLIDLANYALILKALLAYKKQING